MCVSWLASCSSSLQRVRGSEAASAAALARGEVESEGELHLPPAASTVPWDAEPAAAAQLRQTVELVGRSRLAPAAPPPHCYQAAPHCTTG